VAETLYYDIHVFLCTNQRPEGHKRGSCASRGAVKLKDYMKARSKELGLEGPAAPRPLRIQQAGCLDRCELGPVLVIYPEGLWYAPRTREDIDAILLEHVRDGRPVDRLIVHREDRLPEDLAARRDA
jgi:(2Fe-2S) ferredoxin